MKDIITHAIRHKHLLSLSYKNLHRIIEPYLFGMSVEGTVVIYGWQLEGESLSEEMGWRVFDIDDVKKLMLEDRFYKEIRTGYQLGKMDMTIIFCEVELNE